jgi:hypothetical protein
MSPQIWLAALTLFGFALAAFSLLAAKKARSHRMATDRRLEELGHELFEKAAALDRRCDDLRAVADRVDLLEARLRLLELERELARLAGSGRLDSGVRARLETAIAALRNELGGADGAA